MAFSLSRWRYWCPIIAFLPRKRFTPMYLMSFLALGVFWVGQQAQLNRLARSNRSLSRMRIVFLFGVTVIPFSTRPLAEFPVYRTALVVYWLNILFLGVALYFRWTCALHELLRRAEMAHGVPKAIKLRIAIAQALYASGALLCVMNTYCSISFLRLVQLYCVIAPRFGRRA